MTRAPEGGEGGVLNRGPWMVEEDLLLKKYIESNGIQRWSTLPQKAGLMRSGKSCRLRWMNHLRPNVKRGHISPEEEDLIIRLHNLLGNRRVPGRTDNDVKNYWNTHLSKKLACKSFSRGKAVSPIVKSQPLICGDHHKDSTALTVELNQVYPEFESAYSDMKYNGVELQDSIISDDDYKFHRAEDQFFSGTGSIAPWFIEFDMEEDIFLPMARFEQSICTTDLFSDSFISSCTYSDSWDNGFT